MKQAEAAQLAAQNEERRIALEERRLAMEEKRNSLEDRQNEILNKLQKLADTMFLQTDL